MPPVNPKMPMKAMMPGEADPMMGGLAGMREMGGEEPGEYAGEDEGGAKAEGGMGSGVQVVGQNVPETECLMKFPLTGPFWFRPPKHGQS